MAIRVLLRLVDASVDPLASKRGDIIAVMPDTQEWGTKETLPAYSRITITGVTFDEFIQFTEPDLEVLPNHPDTGEPRQGALQQKFRWQVDLDNVPPAKLAEVESGSATFSKNQAQAWVKDKRGA